MTGHVVGITAGDWCL